MTDAPASPMDIVAAAIFAAAVIHTFLSRHIEAVFGFWACVLIAAMAILQGPGLAFDYAVSRRYAEPLFVFAIMVATGTRPVLLSVEKAILRIAASCPGRPQLAKTWLCLALVPLLGSLVTEPAAMTVAALLLRPIVFRHDVPSKAKYFVLGTLFVNVSIGGTLTSFAAPPVLMVAHAWDWTSAFMLATFGWKAAIAVAVNATVAVFVVRRGLPDTGDAQVPDVPSHPPVKEAALVAVFLAGIVVLGGPQQWWLGPLVASLSSSELFYGAAALTAVTDNAALTYLGTLIEGLSPEAKYSLVAGAVAGGGLTVIANAPNPAGVSLVKTGFTNEAVGAAGLAAGALVPTAVALAAFRLL